MSEPTYPLFDQREDQLKTQQAELHSVMQDIERSSPLNRLRGEIEKAIAELPTVHPQGTRENHCDLIHADRLRLILEGSK